MSGGGIPTMALLAIGALAVITAVAVVLLIASKKKGGS